MLAANMDGVREGGWRLEFPEEQKGKADGRIHAVIFFFLK